MKYLPILGALLLSALPAFAGDFIYLECETKTQVRAIDAKTAKVIREFEEEKSLNKTIISRGSTRLTPTTANTLTTFTEIKRVMYR